ncbi:hypothetical protein L218DRAFT_887409 [Marasmius fiardii PR-910]|nr:hypothetical protein L218DRAFT_887409 [Marasmius fiardii PR-910]
MPFNSFVISPLPPSKLKANVLLSNSGTPYTLQDLYDDLEYMTLIRSLPPEYDPLTCPLLVSKDLSIQKVREAYHAEESQACSREFAAAAQGIMLQRPQVLCGWCTYTGHSEKDCHHREANRKHTQDYVWGLLSGQIRPGKKSQKNAGNVVQKETATKVSTVSLSPLLHHWNPDTGATSHMTPHCHWFKNY